MQYVLMQYCVLWSNIGYIFFLPNAALIMFTLLFIQKKKKKNWSDT